MLPCSVACVSQAWLSDSPTADSHVHMCCNAGPGLGSKSPCSWLAPFAPSPQGGAHVMHMEDLAVSL